MNPYEAPQIAREPAQSGDSNQIQSAKYPRSVLYKLLTALFLINTFVILVCWQDGGWGVLGFIFVIGPALNGIAGLISLLWIPYLKHHNANFPAGIHALLSIALPIGAIIGDWFFVASFVPVHGC